MNVDQIMSAPVITLSPESTVRQIAAVFAENRISGAPVVDKGGDLVGIVSESDLLPKSKRIPFSRIRIPTLFEDLPGGETLDAMFTKAAGKTAEDVMTEQPVTIPPSTTAAEAALLMRDEGIKRIPVVDTGELVGILTRSDLVRAIYKMTR